MPSAFASQHPPLPPPLRPGSGDARARKVADFYESLSPATLPRVYQIYANNARFIDPFNDVTGAEAIHGIFKHMFAALQAPRFSVVSSLTEGDQCVLLWNFDARRSGKGVHIHGASHLRFDAQGRVAWHRDYWDPAREIYEALPLLGGLLRWLRRQLASHPVL